MRFVGTSGFVWGLYGVCRKHEFCTFAWVPHSLPPPPTMVVATTPSVSSAAAAADPAACDRSQSINLKRNLKFSAFRGNNCYLGFVICQLEPEQLCKDLETLLLVWRVIFTAWPDILKKFAQHLYITWWDWWLSSSQIFTQPRSILLMNK